MDIKQTVTEYSLSHSPSREGHSRFGGVHYKLITILMVVFTVVLGALIRLIKIDTDPENMLSADEPVRVFHNQTKNRFALHDMVVVGIVNEKDPNGVFNVASLGRIYELTEVARRLRWPDQNDPNEEIGVVEVDLLAPTTVDHIGQGGPGAVKFEWLMTRPLASESQARDGDRLVTTVRLTKLLMNQNLRLSLFGYYSPSDKDVYLRPNVNYKVSDAARCRGRLKHLLRRLPQHILCPIPGQHEPLHRPALQFLSGCSIPGCRARIGLSSQCSCISHPIAEICRH